MIGILINSIQSKNNNTIPKYTTATFTSASVSITSWSTNVASVDADPRSAFSVNDFVWDANGNIIGSIGISVNSITFDNVTS